VAHAIVVNGRLRLALFVGEVAELLLGGSDAASTKAIRALIRSGQLAAVSTGARYLVPASSLLAYLARSGEDEVA
jgi:excisionase family DNA binding protein